LVSGARTGCWRHQRSRGSALAGVLTFCSVLATPLSPNLARFALRWLSQSRFPPATCMPACRPGGDRGPCTRACFLSTILTAHRRLQTRQQCSHRTFTSSLRCTLTHSCALANRSRNTLCMLVADALAHQHLQPLSEHTPGCCSADSNLCCSQQTCDTSHSPAI